MKKLFILLTVLFVASFVNAAQKKPIAEIVTDDLTDETQVTAQGAGDNHVALAWWLPNEFWESLLARDSSTSDVDKKALLNSLSGVSLLAVVQANISNFGAFDFYSKEEIEKNMQVSFTDSKKLTRKLTPMQSVNSDLEIVLGIFKPILGAAMGNLGSNLHFYVLNDKANSSTRLLDPYKEGELIIQLSQRNNTLMTAKIEMPLNSLFIPRLCPNGKEAHISWKYCPWTGKLLQD